MLKVIEMECSRKMDKIKWTNKKKNEEVILLVMVEEKRSFKINIKDRCWNMAGHILTT